MISIDAFILAWGFGQLWMLGWLAAAAAPILIHLWSRRNHGRTPWAAIEFLLAAMQKHAQRIRLQHWLLLAVRTLIVLLVVLAVAKPFLDRVGLGYAPGRRTHYVLVVDSSYSMAYRAGDQTRFQRAQQVAADIVRSSGRGDGFSLVQMSAPPRAVIASATTDAAAAVDEIANLRLQHTGADVTATLDQIVGIVDRAQSENTQFEQTQVFFLTDLGRNSWAAADESDDDRAEREAKFESFSNAASLVLIDLGQPDRENLAVTDLATTDAFATTTAPSPLEAVVENFGGREVIGRPVELLVDGASTAATTVDVPAGGQTAVRFSHTFQTPGSHRVEVRLGPPTFSSSTAPENAAAADAVDGLPNDRLAVDDHCWLVLPVKEQLRVLCVSGKPGSTYYLSRALDPMPSEPSAIRVEEIAESELIERDLAQFDAVFLCNVAQFTTREATLLHAYLEQGGGLVFFLGDQVMADRYNAQLAATTDHALRVLPARLGNVVDDAVHYLDPRDHYDHPLVAVFRDQQQSGLQTTPIFRYARLEVPDEWSRAQTALVFQSGDPAIVEEAIQDGRSIVVATAASLDPNSPSPWTSMPTSPSFLPLVRELLARAVEPLGARYNLKVGETLRATVPPGNATATVTVSPPNGDAVELRVQTSDDGAFWSLGSVDESGHYAVATETSPDAPHFFAANVDTRESDLTRVDVDQLSPHLLVHAATSPMRAVAAGEMTAPFIARTGVHAWLLVAALLLLLLETWMAWRFGRATS